MKMQVKHFPVHVMYLIVYQVTVWVQPNVHWCIEARHIIDEIRFKSRKTTHLRHV